MALAVLNIAPSPSINPVRAPACSPKMDAPTMPTSTPMPNMTAAPMTAASVVMTGPTRKAVIALGLASLGRVVVMDLSSTDPPNGLSLVMACRAGTVIAMTRARTLVAVRDGLGVVAAGLVGGWLLTAVASVAYRPGGHHGSPLDWLRISGWLVAMSFGAPLHFHSGTTHGQVGIVPLTVTLLMIVVAARQGRGSLLDALVCGISASPTVRLATDVTRSTIPSYGQHPRVHYSVPLLPAMVGCLLVVTAAYALGARRWTGAWTRTLAGALRAAMVVGGVASLVSVGGALTWDSFPAKALGTVPGLLGDGAAWLGGFSLGGRLTANLSTPIPLLSGNLGLGLVTGGAWLVAYLLLLVPLGGAVLAGRRQLHGAVELREWAEFGRAVVCNAVLWLLLAEASRLRFSGRIGADIFSGSAGPDPLSTVFVAALWGAVAAVIGLSLLPRTKN